MNRIQLLTEQVANQIAAGEVIERPASVVKELVENALDATAAHITVEVQAGGRGLIRVTDDGIGMSRDDALLCFERHATSKIQSAEDLNTIGSLGFRGEALPSVASVSRLTLTTRQRDSDEVEATCVQINGGRILGVRSASSPPGTCVEVRQLFFNLPARRKFLRSEETERSHIHHYLVLAALAFPEVGFTFVDDRRTVWQLVPLPIGPSPEGRHSALRERLRALYGSDLKLVSVDTQTDLHGISDMSRVSGPERGELGKADLRVWGFIGAPGVSRATREDQHLFVNRRPIEHRGLNLALLEGYHTALMKGRYPVACLFIESRPGEVDVNVHPTKKEVKFRSEYAVRQAVTDAVRLALLRWHTQQASPGLLLTRKSTAQSTPTPDQLPGQSRLSKPTAAQQTAIQSVVPLPVGARESGRTSDHPETSVEATTESERSLAASVPVRKEGLAAPVPEREETEGGVGVEGAGAGVVPGGIQQDSSAESVPLLSVPLRLIGVIGRLYVLLESDRGLVLLDQHAAHERVLYERTLKRLDQGQAPCQRLLLPATVELAPRDVQFLREHLTTLNRLGVSLSEFGEQTFLLDGLPPYVRASEARQFVIDVLDELKSAGQAVNTLRLGEEMVAKTVCRRAVKANDPLEGTELEALICELRRCDMPYTCPHGRPTIIEINYRELEKKFGRVT